MNRNLVRIFRVSCRLLLLSKATKLVPKEAMQPRPHKKAIAPRLQ